VAFACLFVPDFPVQAVVRLEPELRDKAVVVLEGAAPLTRVFAANAATRAMGVEIGMAKVQAEAFSGIVWRWRSPAQEATAHRALLDCAWTISPRVETKVNGGKEPLPDAVVLDIAGCEKLFGAPEKIASDLQRVAEKVGFAANVAIAGNAEAAVCAARGFAGVTIIAAGEESGKLGTLPVNALPLSQEFLETLARWGIRTCGEFAALPEVAVVERFGQEGRRWQLLARGTEPRPLMAKEPELEFEECMELEFAIELLEQLLFVLNRLLEQLCVRLRMHVLAASEIRVILMLEKNREEESRDADRNCGVNATNVNAGTERRGSPSVKTGEFRIEGRGRPLPYRDELAPDSKVGNGNRLHKEEKQLHERVLRLPVPARESQFLLKLLKLDLEAHPPNAPVTGVKMVAIPARARARQMGLYLPLSPEPEKLEVTLARISATVGEGRVGAPVLLDTHRPNAFRQEKFVLAEANEKKNAGITAKAGSDVEGEASPSFIGMQNKGGASPSPTGISQAKTGVGRTNDAKRAAAATAALRIYRPVLPATVELYKTKPARIVCDGVQRRVLAYAGPWRTKGDWWAETVWARDEWDVLMHALRPKLEKESGREAESETAMYRIYRDLRSRQWFVEGIYD
jgi:protein ImuB